MIGPFCFVLAVLASPFKSKLRLEAENAVLRHQLMVLRRRLHGRVRLTNNDRWFFIQLYRWVPSILNVTSCRMDYFLPGVAPTHRKIEVPFAVIAHFRDGRLAHEHIYWIRRRSSSSGPCSQS